MTEETATAIEPSIPHKISRQIREVKKIFISDVSPSIKRHDYFVGKGERRRQKRRKTGSAQRQAQAIGEIKFSPFAMTLGHDMTIATTASQRIATGRGQLMPEVIIPSAQPNQLISVFVIAIVSGLEEELFLLQKVQHKFAPGFPGGGIEDGETILQAAKREFKEETRGKDKLAGVNLDNYAPVSIGTFTLDRAQNGERGAVVLVELPANEMNNIVAGGGDEEGETVEEVYFLTFAEVQENLPNILANSRKVWEVYINHLVN